MEEEEHTHMTTFSTRRIPVFDAYDTGDQYVCWCPFCEKLHRHSRAEGHRVAHCSERPIKRSDGYMWSPFKATGYILKHVGKLAPAQAKWFRRMTRDQKPVEYDHYTQCQALVERWRD